MSATGHATRRGSAAAATRAGVRCVWLRTRVCVGVGGCGCGCACGWGGKRWLRNLAVLFFNSHAFASLFLRPACASKISGSLGFLLSKVRFLLSKVPTY